PLSTATRLAALRHHVLVMAPVKVAPLLVGERAAAGAHLSNLAEEALARGRRGKEQQKAGRRIAVVLEPVHRPLRHVQERSRLAGYGGVAVVQTDVAGEHVERFGEGGVDVAPRTAASRQHVVAKEAVALGGERAGRYEADARRR